MEKTYRQERIELEGETIVEAVEAVSLQMTLRARKIGETSEASFLFLTAGNGEKISYAIESLEELDDLIGALKLIKDRIILENDKVKAQS